MKKIFVILCLSILFMGMGGINEDETKLPKLKENIRLEITDLDGYQIILENASIADHAYISGNAGRGKQIVELNKIRKVDIKPLSEKEVTAEIILKNNEVIKLTLNGNQKLKGRSRFGVYSVKVSDIKRVVFLD